VIQFAQDLSLRFEMTDYLACHFERIARNLSLLYSAIHSNCITTPGAPIFARAGKKGKLQVL
jgi:hypothetical protein